MDYFLKKIDSCSLVVFLIKEIFRNNKNFLILEGPRVIRYITVREEKLPLDSIERFHLLNILKVFVKCKGKIVLKNQNEILIQLASIEEEKI